MQIYFHRVIILTLVLQGFVAVGQTVPQAYQDLYSTLNTQISNFDSAVKSRWSGTTAAVNYAPQLETASSAQYTGLLAPGYYDYVVEPQLDELQALGAKGIKVQVSFPILYAPFYGANQSLYQSIAGFYQQLASDIHSRGLKLIVESTAENQFPGANAADFTSYYLTLPWASYMTGRAQNALNTVQLMHPDYMTLLSEPDTEAAYTGQTNVGTLSGSTQLLQSILSTLQTAGVTGVSLGAGAGTWLPSLTQYIQSFAATSVQYIDVHIYPINESYLMNALTAADTAHAAGKQVALSGLWDFKVRDSELGLLSLMQVASRDPFSFWQPIDSAFFQAMSDYCNLEQVLFISPFWSHYFFAYLDYTSYGSTPAGPLLIDSNSASASAELAGLSSTTGQNWLKLSIPQPDTTPPATPAPPVSPNVFATSAMLTWSRTTDNVGVAAYKVFRNGTLLTTTSLLNYRDNGLAPGTNYSYTIEAVDASGNVSPPSSVLNIQTTTATPPTVPTAFAGHAISTTQVTLTWNASSSSFGIGGYEIYRGSSLGNLVEYDVTQTTSYTDVQVGPSLTYYYAILAYDTRGNQSSLTAPVAVTTPLEAPPSTPGTPVAQVLAFNQVKLSWTGSTSSVTIGGYMIYRGASPATLAQITTSYVPAVTDQYASPSTTYYYAVRAYDNNGVLSALSSTVSVITPAQPPPSAPAQLIGQAAAYNQVALSWPAASSPAGIGGYVVYRGRSSSALSQVGTTTTLTYTDTTMLPSTTYYYAVSAYDKYGLLSAQSPLAIVATPAEPLPSTPSQLSAPTLIYNSVGLTWTASSSPVGLWGYAIYRGTSPSSLSALGSSNTAAYTDNTVAPTSTYYYAVAAVDTYGLQSARSSAMSATTPKQAGPSVPTQVTARALAYNSVSVSWTASTSPVGLWGYAIYRGTSPSSLSIIGSSKTTTYSDTQAKPSTTFYYAVVAYDTYGLASGQSTAASATTPKEPAPSVPSGLTFKTVASNLVSLAWSASSSSSGIGGYVVYRGISPTSLSAIGSSTTVSYSDTTVRGSTTFYYSVAAYDVYGLLSAQTPVSSVATP